MKTTFCPKVYQIIIHMIKGTVNNMKMEIVYRNIHNLFGDIFEGKNCIF